MTDYQEKIEIMQDAIEKAMERNNLLQQEVRFETVKFEQMEAIADKKSEQIEELEEEIDEMNEKLSEERKIYKEKLWHYVEEIAQVRFLHFF